MSQALTRGLQDFRQRIRALAEPDVTGGMHPVDFLQRYFYLYDTAALLTLYPSQAGAIREALSRDDSGNYNYNTVLWSWPKKSAKSTIIAAVADYVACRKDRASIMLIANDRRQADSRVGYYMRENIKIGARRGYPDDPGNRMQRFRQQTVITNRGYEIVYPNGSRVEMLPIDPEGEAGGNDDLIVFSELWGWKHDSHQRMFAEMTLSPTKFGQSQRWIDTYAGYRGASPILERLYEQAVVDGQQLDVPGNPQCYAAGGLFATWVTRPTLPWQTPEYYAAEREALPPEQFLRMHRNQWIESVDAFVPSEWWDACADSGIQPLDPYDEMVIALDAGVSSDCFAMVAVSRDRRFNDYSGGDDSTPDHLVRRYARAWTPPRGGKLKFSGYPESPLAELRRLCAKYNVVQVTYDPWQLEHFASEFRDEWTNDVVPFTQNTERAVADKRLYDMIRTKRFHHAGERDELRTHILNADKDVSGDERRLRIVKRDDTKKIDLAVALSMACQRAVEQIPK